MKELAQREREVLRMRAHGLTMKAVAIDLGVSEMTVKHHCNRAYGKLGVGGLVEAMHVLGWARVPDR